MNAVEPAKESLGARIAAGHRRTISRSISLIENNDPQAAMVLKEAHALGGNALVIGITGVPGAGKSTLVPALATRFVAQRKRVAIVAVDPSSPLSGGAILGDRIRNTSGDSTIYFRSIASRGSLGGLSQTIDDVVTLLEAAFDVILIETVGTGQSEIAITDVAHTTVVVLAPGLGDEVQAMKAGILEVAHLITVNKADTDATGARIAVDTLRTTLEVTGRAHGLSAGANPAKDGRPAQWHAPVRAISALSGDGLDDIVSCLNAHRGFLDEAGLAAAWKTRRRTARFQAALKDALAQFMRDDPAAAAVVAAIEAEVAAARRDPLSAASAVVRECFGRRTS